MTLVLRVITDSNSLVKLWEKNPGLRSTSLLQDCDHIVSVEVCPWAEEEGLQKQGLNSPLVGHLCLCLAMNPWHVLTKEACLSACLFVLATLCLLHCSWVSPLFNRKAKVLKILPRAEEMAQPVQSTCHGSLKTWAQIPGTHLRLATVGRICSSMGGRNKRFPA